MGLEDTKKVLDEYCEKIYGKTKIVTVKIIGESRPNER